MIISTSLDAFRRESLGVEIVELSPLREGSRSGAGQNELAVDQALANFVADLFVILHPATLPMLERMFEDAKRDFETDGEWQLKRRAEIGIAAVCIAAREQDAVEN